MTPPARAVHAPELPVLLLVPVLPQALLALVRGHLVPLTLFSARHVRYCLSSCSSSPMKRSTPLRMTVSCTNVLYFRRLAMACALLSSVAYVRPRQNHTSGHPWGSSP